MSTGIRKRTDVALKALQKAKERNDAMQAKTKAGSPAWLGHEEIDDHLYEAIVALDAD